MTTTVEQTFIVGNYPMLHPIPEKDYDPWRFELSSIGKWTILPSDYFNPLYGIGGFHIKKNTYSIHQYSASWRDSKERYRDQVTHRLAFYVGHRTGEVLSRLIAEFKFENMGDAFRNLFSKLASHSHR